MVDASVIKAQRKRPNKGVDGENTQDPEAADNVKTASDGNKQSTDGVQADINVDEDGFIKLTDCTAGNIHDGCCFTDLLSARQSQVYADSAYAIRKMAAWLVEQGIENRG